MIRITEIRKFALIGDCLPRKYGIATFTEDLHEDRINENQGAESTLAFLLSLAELKLVESSLATFRRAEMADGGQG